jgi:hypothetical protein
MKRALLLAFIFVAPLAWGQPDASKHSIILKFDYDFRLTPACTSATKKNCVERFEVYDISAGLAKCTKLACLAVPSDAKGLVKGLSVTTPSLLFETGKHLLAVTAQMPNGKESDPMKCTVWVEIP